MAFDSSSATDVQKLKTELTTDPISMGYNLNGSQSRIAFLLNDPASNVGGEVTGDDLTISLFLDAIAANPESLTVGGQFTQGELETIKLIFEASGSLDDNIERYRAQITGMFPANDGLRQTLEAQTRKLSRAEVLFGEDTRITENDIGIALSS